jgi:hypothetical protein
LIAAPQQASRALGLGPLSLEQALTPGQILGAIILFALLFSADRKSAATFGFDELGQGRLCFRYRMRISQIATGAGWQGAMQTLVALRGIVHALRGWPNPLGVALNTAEPVFDANDQCVSAKIGCQLETIAHGVVSFARRTRFFATNWKTTGVGNI